MIPTEILRQKVTQKQKAILKLMEISILISIRKEILRLMGILI